MLWSITTCLAASIALGEVAAQPSNGRFTLNLERGSPRTRSIYRRDESGNAEVESIYEGTDWVTSMKVGGQTLRAQIDTGSADLWFASVMLPEKYITKHLKHNTLYDPSKSTTWTQSTSKIFNISYDVGELGASGLVGTETVELGGATVTNMLIGAATNLFGQGIIDTVYDGTMGLGWQSGNSIQTIQGSSAPGPTFMQAVQSQLDQPVFTADFRANSGESLSFGFVDSSLYSGSLSTIAVDNSSSFWSIKNVKFTSGGKQLGESDGISILMDTGGTATTVSTAIARDYWSQVPSAKLASSDGVWSFDCSAASLPDLTFNFAEGSSATIPGSILNVSSTDNGDGTCAGGLQGTANGLSNAGYGFFNRYFTVWNQAVPHMQFAPYSSKVETASTNDANLPTSTDEPGVPAVTATGGSSSPSSSSGPSHSGSSSSSGSFTSSVSFSSANGSGSSAIPVDSSSSSISATPTPSNTLSSQISSAALTTFSSSATLSSPSNSGSSSTLTTSSTSGGPTATTSTSSGSATPSSTGAATTVRVPHLGLGLSAGVMLLISLTIV